jgi:hypothetical protein
MWHSCERYEEDDTDGEATPDPRTMRFANGFGSLAAAGCSALKVATHLHF